MYAPKEMRIIFSHGSTNSISGSSTGILSIAPTEVISPRPSPKLPPSMARKEASTRKLSWTIAGENPMARNTPMPCRRPTTARAVMTPSATIPTSRPNYMKPISRLKRAFWAA